MGGSATLMWSAEDGATPSASRSLARALSTFVPLSVASFPATERVPESARLVPIGDLVYCDFVWGARVSTRDTSGLGGDSGAYVALAAIHAGSEIVTNDAGKFVLVPEDVVLWDCQTAMSTQVQDFSRKNALPISHRLLAHIISKWRSARLRLHQLGHLSRLFAQRYGESPSEF